MADKTIQYCFTMADNSQEIFNLRFDPHSLALLNPVDQPWPDWTALGFHQCPNCPLHPEEQPHCPVAVCLIQVVDRFHGHDPHEEVDLEVITDERLIAQHTTVESGVCSLMGLLMATSGCPHTAFFRPMARFHLALASEEETFYRACSMYTMALFFQAHNGKQPDQGLKGLSRLYRNLHIVNTAVVERLRAARETDPSLNAIVLLDNYVLFLPHLIEKSLEEVRYLFEPFLSDPYRLLEGE